MRKKLLAAIERAMIDLFFAQAELESPDCNEDGESSALAHIGQAVAELNQAMRPETGAQQEDS